MVTGTLVTGSGAIYWHVKDKDELLGAATDAVVAATMTADAAVATPREAVRALALGVGAQDVADRRGFRPDASRDEFPTAVAEAWTSLDAEEYAFTRIVADRLRDHDDREEFPAGIDLILAGITAGVP